MQSLMVVEKRGDFHAKSFVRNVSTCRPERVLGLHERMRHNKGDGV